MRWHVLHCLLGVPSGTKPALPSILPILPIFSTFQINIFALTCLTWSLLLGEPKPGHLQ